MSERFRFPPGWRLPGLSAEEQKQLQTLVAQLYEGLDKALSAFFRGVAIVGLFQHHEVKGRQGTLHAGPLRRNADEGWGVDGVRLENGMPITLWKGAVCIQGPLHGLPSRPAFHFPSPEGHRTVIPLAEGDRIEIYVPEEERGEEAEP